MKTKREAEGLRDRLVARNPGAEYEVLKDPDPTIPRRIGPWYVKRTKRPKKET